MATIARIALIAMLGLLLAGCNGQEDRNMDETRMEGNNARQSENADRDGDAAIDAGSDADSYTDSDAGSLAALASGNREFAFALFDQVRTTDPDDNVFLSPHSISLALAMVHAGARQATRDQMTDTLRFELDDDALHRAFTELDQALAARAGDGPDDDGKAFELDIVNQTWGQEGFEFRQEYLDHLARHYDAMVRLVDFESEFEAIRVKINRWVAEQTSDRIRDLLPPESLTPETRFILVNAIYFLASWKHAFEEDDTVEAPFTRLDGTTVDVPLMRQTERLGLYRSDDTVAVAMPYVGENVSMIALMPASPDDDFAAWESRLDRAAFDRIVQDLEPGRVQVHFPRFESGSHVGLARQLEAMGMTDAFDECRADFSGITGSPPCIPNESIYIDQVFHKTFIRVDEAGTEAAAATAVVMMETTALQPSPPEVRFDRPFVYAIHDRPTGTILFLGRLVDPDAG